jgi:hypothetical protein
LVAPGRENVACVYDVWGYGFDGRIVFYGFSDFTDFFAGRRPNHKDVATRYVAKTPVEQSVGVMLLQNGVYNVGVCVVFYVNVEHTQYIVGGIGVPFYRKLD